ncbi:DUF4880 domain-containing protein [Pseudomonas syringae]|nr:DUF4880 domain-containing protein [Pseudomonas syringae]
MSRGQTARDQSVDESVLDQALNWMVTLQSGTSGVAEQRACQQWRNENPQHELAWQRLVGLGRDMRNSTHAVSASNARQLLNARSTSSRRTLLKGFVGLGVTTCLGLSLRERALLPELFSDYHTATGERRQLRLANAVELQLDTRTALDIRGADMTLNLGRVLLNTGTSDMTAIKTANGWVRPTALSRLIISQDLPRRPGTEVQILAGSASVEPLHGVGTKLNVGQQLTFDSVRNGQLNNVPASAEAWAKGLLIAERMPLGEVIEQLDRYRRGVLRCDPAVAGLQVSGSFSLDHPDASLDLLTKVLPLRVQRVFGYLATVVAA